MFDVVSARYMNLRWCENSSWYEMKAIYPKSEM